ncbi:FliM/FliN family flagellar motor switch protein [Pandoraea oxalativorans]|uniref:Flagellar motor switch protein FliN-like C-terminal domain-containing protein n=1 Tax=Pandoraea oxalativorans TaxID=573737 RepID=A0A0G3ICD3_9BURK|nr:FliM/FliN family flagellar motor switch protein [Pandoraea oxalativorans]AKK24857.1 hypothetical protein MB84_29235 [Pandoraea oxalativorans]
MSAERPTPLSVFELSRMGASAELEGARLIADRAGANGPGVRLRARCGGEPLCFWVPEPAWCDWIAPQLATHAWTQVPPDLLPLVAAWTLAPLDGWLQRLGAQALCAPEVDAGDAPPPGWRFTLQEGDRRLPLYVQEAPAGVMQVLLAALAPSPEQHHELALALGWCQLAGDAPAHVAVGDALPLLGMAETLDTLWLHPEASPGRLQLLDDRHAVIAAAPLPWVEELPDTVRLAVEVGRVRMSAAALADWTPGTDVALEARAHVALRLTQGERLWGQGRLLRLDDAWAVRIDARAD